MKCSTDGTKLAISPVNTARMHSKTVAHEICIAVAGACLPVKAYCTTSAFVASEAAWYIMGRNGLKVRHNTEPADA